MADSDMTAGRLGPSRTSSPTHPYTRRLLTWNASAAVVFFAVTTLLAVAGSEQAAYVALLGGAGFTSLAATMMFRLICLR